MSERTSESTRSTLYTSMLYEFYVLTRDLHYIQVGQWIAHNRIQHEVHLNRTRFWIDEGPLLTEFLLRWRDVCPPVDPLEDKTTGIINIVK
jgi:hypothetical protein